MVPFHNLFVSGDKYFTFNNLVVYKFSALHIDLLRQKTCHGLPIRVTGRINGMCLYFAILILKLLGYTLSQDTPGKETYPTHLAVDTDVFAKVFHHKKIQAHKEQ